jgi:phosphate transport system permease protein
MTALAATSASRRRTDVFMRGLLAAGTVLALIPLVLIVYYVILKGAGAWGVKFFTKDPINSGGFGDEGGFKSAILGTIEIVLIASVIAIPLGIGVALWLTEYSQLGRMRPLGTIVRYFIDVMTGVPAIMFGIFIYILVVLPKGGTFAGWEGSLALALLMLPIVARSAEVVLLLVPGSLREAALALGAARWKVVLRVVLPAAMTGLVTGSLLAIARAAGETAPLLFVIGGGVQKTTFDPTQQMNSLPTQIFANLGMNDQGLYSRAWGGALVLITLIMLLNIVGRLVSSRSARV